MWLFNMGQEQTQAPIAMKTGHGSGDRIILLGTELQQGEITFDIL